MHLDWRCSQEQLRSPALPRPLAPDPASWGGARSVGGANSWSRAVIGGVRETAPLPRSTGRAEVAENSNSWNPFAPKRGPFGLGYRCVINQQDAFLASPLGPDGALRMRGWLLNWNRLVFHLTGCLVSVECIPSTPEPLRCRGDDKQRGETLESYVSELD